MKKINLQTHTVLVVTLFLIILVDCSVGWLVYKNNKKLVASPKTPDHIMTGCQTLQSGSHVCY